MDLSALGFAKTSYDLDQTRALLGSAANDPAELTALGRALTAGRRITFAIGDGQACAISFRGNSGGDGWATSFEVNKGGVTLKGYLGGLAYSQGASAGAYAVDLVRGEVTNHCTAVSTTLPSQVLRKFFQVTGVTLDSVLKTWESDAPSAAARVLSQLGIEILPSRQAHSVEFVELPLSVEKRTERERFIAGLRTMIESQIVGVPLGAAAYSTGKTEPRTIRSGFMPHHEYLKELNGDYLGCNWTGSLWDFVTSLPLHLESQGYTYSGGAWTKDAAQKSAA